MESQPQNPEFRINPKTLTHVTFIHKHINSLPNRIFFLSSVEIF